MQFSEIKKEFLKKAVEPAQALRLAINMKLGQRNQLQITNSQSTIQVNAINSQRQFRNSNQRQNLQVQTRLANHLCRNCGLTWSTNHKDDCIAKVKTVTTVVSKTFLLLYVGNRNPLLQKMSAPM